jgi:hypothetical protein
VSQQALNRSDNEKKSGQGIALIMNSKISEIKMIVSGNRSIVVPGAALTLLLAIYFIGWHYTIITFGSFYSVLDVADSFMKRSIYYLIASAVIASIVCAAMIAVKKVMIKKIIIGIVLALFVASEVIRMFDWGALYFNGNHIDSNFWAHAFYTDGMVFLFTKESFMIYATVITFFILMLYIIKKIYRHTNLEK